MKALCFDQKTKTVVCTLFKVLLKCHRSISAIQEHVKKCSILGDPEKKINTNWSVLSNQQLVIISWHLIEEEEDEELFDEEREDEVLMVTTEIYSLCNHNIHNLF